MEAFDIPMAPHLPQVPDNVEAPDEDQAQLSGTFYESEMGRLDSLRSFGVETANDLLTNATSRAFQRNVRSNSVMSTSSQIREQLARRHGGCIDWTRPQSVDKVKDVCRLLKRLFWAFEEVEHQAEDEDEGLARRIKDSRGRAHFRKIVGRIVLGRPFTGFFLVLTLYALFGPDICAAYGHTALNREDKTLAIFNTVVLFFFVVEEVMHCIGIPEYVCSTRFWIDSLATFSIIGDSVIASELLQSDEGVSVWSSRVTRILRIGGRSSKFIRFLRAARFLQVVRLVPKVQEWMQRDMKELALELWVKRMTHIARFFRGGDVHGRFMAVDWEVLNMAMEMVFPEPDRPRQTWVSSLRKSFSPGNRSNIVGGRFEWLYCDDGGTLFDVLDDLLTTTVGQRSYQSCMDDINRMKESCAIVERASARLTYKLCILVLMLLMTMQFLLGDESDFLAQQGLGQVDALNIDAHNMVSPSEVCEIIQEYTQVHSDEKLVLLTTERGRVYWRPGCHCCDPEEVRAGPPQTGILTPGGLAETTVRGMGLEMHEIVVLAILDPATGDVSSLAIFDTSELERTYAENHVLQTVVVVVLLTGLVLYFATDMKNLSNDNVLHPLWDLMDDMCALQNIELLSDGADPSEPSPVKARQLFQRHFARGPRKRCCRQNIPKADELEHLRSAFDKLRMAIMSWSKYVPVVLLKHLMEARIEASIGCSFCEVCVVFVAVNDFDQKVCVNKDPKEVLNLMGGLLNRIYDALTNNSGVMLEFIGDEVLAVFNAPMTVTFYQECAINAALDAQHSVKLFNKDLSLLSSVHKARVLVGNLGSPTRMKYGVLGDGVNLSARLKSLNTRYDTSLLVSEEALDFPGVEETFVYRPVGDLILKGRTTATSTYEVLGKYEESSPKLKGVARTQTVAFEMFKARRFSEAKVLFTQVHDSLFAVVGKTEGDKISAHFMSLCDTYLEHPPPEGWDGSEHLTQKSFH